jgi:hypothetical protein
MEGHAPAVERVAPAQRSRERAMEPMTGPDRLRWLEQNVEGISHELQSLRVQLRAVTLAPPALRKDERRIAELLTRQMALLGAQCDLLLDQLSRLRRTD